MHKADEIATTLYASQCLVINIFPQEVKMLVNINLTNTDITAKLSA